MPDDSGLHESLKRQDFPMAGSERGFGIVFAVFFFILGIFPLLDSSPVRVWSLWVSIVFFNRSLCRTKPT